MTISRTRGVILTLILITLAVGASAQDIRARVQGLVSDTTGGIMPGVWGPAPVKTGVSPGMEVPLPRREGAPSGPEGGQ